MTAVFKHLDSMNNIVFKAGPVLTKPEHSKLVASFYIYRKAYNWHLIAYRYVVLFWLMSFKAHMFLSYQKQTQLEGLAKSSLKNQKCEWKVRDKIHMTATYFYDV